MAEERILEIYKLKTNSILLSFAISGKSTVKTIANSKKLIMKMDFVCMHYITFFLGTDPSEGTYKSKTTKTQEYEHRLIHQVFLGLQRIVLN